MTIVAGFRVRDGIVMCGDTMYSGGIKLHQSKLHGITIADSLDESDHLSMVFGLAGHEGNASMAIEDCIDAIKEIPREQRSLRRVTKALRASVLEINRLYIDGRSDIERFDLIVGSWLPRGGGHQLFSTMGAGIIRKSEHGYDCIGTGMYIGHYLIRPVFKPRLMGIREAVLLAIQAIMAAKEWDEGCGGDTQFMTILRGGKLSGVVPYDPKSSESYIDNFERSCRQLLFDSGNPQLEDSAFNVRLAEFVEMTRALRSIWTGRWDEHMGRIISKLTADEKPSPEQTTDSSNPPPSSESTRED